MKTLKVILTIAYVCVSIGCLAQHKEKGILILSPSRDHMSFDLFVPGNIDTNKNLKENLNNLRDTAIRFSTYKPSLLKQSMLKRAVKMVNESLIKGAPGEENLLVLPVEAKFDDEEFNKDMPDEFYEYEVILHDKTVVKIYDQKKPIFKKLKILRLPTKDAANTGLPK